jgi:hypothetical protein
VLVKFRILWVISSAVGLASTFGQEAPSVTPLTPATPTESTAPDPTAVAPVDPSIPVDPNAPAAPVVGPILPSTAPTPLIYPNAVPPSPDQEVTPLSPDLTPIPPEPIPLDLPPDPWIDAEEEATSVNTTEGDISNESLLDRADFTSLPSAPSGFSGFSGSPQLFRGNRSSSKPLTIGLSGIGTYDTNIYESSGEIGAGNDKEDDFIFSVGTDLRYRTGYKNWRIEGRYRPKYEAYSSHSNLSGFTHAADLATAYEGGKLEASAQAGFAMNRGSNRYYADFIEQTRYFYRLSANYEISPKTIISSHLDQSWTEVEESAFDDTASFEAGLAALWKFSPLTQIGPGIRYTLRSGDDREDRTTVGPTLNINYKLTQKVSLTSRVGLDFVEYEDSGSGDSTVSAAIGLTYQANVLWGMKFSLYRDTEADPSRAGAYNEITSARIAYFRNIRRASVELGLGYETITYDESTVVLNPRADRDFLTLDASISHPLFKGTSEGTLFIKYRDQSSDDAREDWDGLQIGCGLSRQF